MPSLWTSLTTRAVAPRTSSRTVASVTCCTRCVGYASAEVHSQHPYARHGFSCKWAASRRMLPELPEHRAVSCKGAPLKIYSCSFPPSCNGSSVLRKEIKLRSRGSTGRSKGSPLGWQQYASVSDANIMVARVCVLLAIAAARRLWWVLEQPTNSLLEHHPVFQAFLGSPYID